MRASHAARLRVPRTPHTASSAVSFGEGAALPPVCVRRHVPTRLRALKPAAARSAARRDSPHAPSAAALGCVSIVGNFIGTFAIIFAGIWVSSLFTGVPIAPVGYSFFKRAVVA